MIPTKEWKEYKIGTICEVLSSKRIFAADYVETGIPFYRSKEIIQKSLGENIEEKLYISKEKFLDIKTKFGVPQKLDLLLSAVGERSGISYLVNTDEEFYFKDGNLIWFRNFNSSLINSNYLYYWLKSYTGQNSLQNLMIGSAQKALTIIGIKGLSIKLPPLETQEKIARVLSSLDDKIELNNKINQNLEQQAQAIFKSWFVDFEPFGGKMPDDWEEKTLDEFCNIFTGKKNANQFDENGKNLFFTCGPIHLKINSFIYEGPAVIIAGNGAYTGRIRFYNGKFDLYQRTYACTLKEDINVDYIYLLYIIIKNVLQEKIMGGTHGSAIPYIVMNDIAKFKLDYNKNVFDKLSKIIKSFVCIIQKNNNENEKLKQLRDTLLPKLMSGEIDVDKVGV